MKTVLIDDAFIKREEAITARMIRQVCRAGLEPDLKRIARRAHAEAIDQALRQGVKP